MAPTITIRSARAGDSDTVVPLIHSSGPAAFDYVFSSPVFSNTASSAKVFSGKDFSSTSNDDTPHNRSPQNFLQKAFVDGRGEFGYKVHSVVLADDRIIGVGAGYSGANALAFTLAAAHQIIGQYGLLAGLGVIRRGLSVERVVPPPVARRLFYIGHLGIALGLRGQGIGSQLIEHFLAQGRDAGCDRAALDVSCANPRAQALYEKIGFRVAGQHRSTLHNRFARVPDHRRMEMAL